MDEGYDAFTDSYALHRFERGVAVGMGLAAFLFVVVGLLRGFGLIEGGASGTAEPAPDFAAGMMWMVAATALGIISVAMAGTRQHPGALAGHEGWPAHMLWSIGVAITLVLVLLGLLVGHDLLRAGTTVQDGVLCGMAAVVGGLVSWALHAAVPEATVERARIGRSIGSPPRAASTPGGG